MFTKESQPASIINDALKVGINAQYPGNKLSSFIYQIDVNIRSNPNIDKKLDIILFKIFILVYAMMPPIAIYQNRAKGK